MKALLIGMLLCAGNACAQDFQFLYIEASEGNASGGHVAVQLGNEVYHYQYEDSFIRLFKHPADTFRANYQLKQNRNIHIADIQVSDRVYDQVSNYFKLRYFGQKQHVKRLKAAQEDQALLQALLRKKQGDLEKNGLYEPNFSLRLQGAGLFYPEGGDKANNELNWCDSAHASTKILSDIKQQLESRYGKDFLAQKIKSLRLEIGNLIPSSLEDAASTQYSFSEHYTDLLNGLLALQVIEKPQPLTDSSCFQLLDPEFKLTDEAIKQAKTLQQKLFLSAQSLVNSNRPDWGYALFVELARLVALEHSIQTLQWTFIDDTDEGATTIPNRQLTLYGNHLQKKRLEDLKNLHKAVLEFSLATSGYEQNYAVLEIMANRYQQWLSVGRNNELRYRSERPLPAKSIPATPFLSTRLSEEKIAHALRLKGLEIERLTEKDTDLNFYHLLTKNCVTALFELINASVSGQTKELLGGSIDPAKSIIPFQAFDRVLETYHVVKTRELPAYRLQKLAVMYQHEADSLVYIRESNIFSSSLYKHNPDDAWFVFFTDDTILLRPVLGAVNALAATSQSIMGLFTWPFDGGREIKVGARGILASLPELLFFNIRKGSYPYPIEN